MRTRKMALYPAHLRLRQQKQISHGEASSPRIGQINLSKHRRGKFDYLGDSNVSHVSRLFYRSPSSGVPLGAVARPANEKTITPNSSDSQLVFLEEKRQISPQMAPCEDNIVAEPAHT
jgi:hypothetical protein